MPSKNKHGRSPSPEQDDSDEQHQLGEDEYIVDYILHERKGDNVQPEYLIKWQGYREEESTWQVAADITAGAENIFARWEGDKQRVKQGFADPFDLERFEARQFAFYNPGVAVPVKKKAKASSVVTQKSVAQAPRKKAVDRLFVQQDSGDSDSSSDEPLMQKGKGRTPTKKVDSPVAKSVEPSRPRLFQTLPSQGATKENVKIGSKTTEARAVQGDQAKTTAESRKRKESPTQLDQNEPKRTKTVPMTPNNVAKTTASAAKPKALPAGLNAPSRAKSPPPQGKVTKVAASPPMAKSIATKPVAKHDTKPTTKPAPISALKAVSKPVSDAPSKIVPKAPSKPISKDPVPAQKVFGGAEPVLRTRKLTDGKIYSPSHVQNIIKKNQDGKAPAAEELMLQAPGEMSARPFRHQEPNSRRPSTTTTSVDPQLNPQRRASVQQEASPTAQTVPLICYHFFNRQACPEGELHCRFHHQLRDDMDMADPVLHEQARQSKRNPEQWPKFQTPVIVCSHDTRSPGCFRSHSCLFAHWQPTRGDWKYHDISALDPRKMITCAFWAEGTCRYSAEQCKFAHEQFGEVAYKTAPTCPFWYAHVYEDGKHPCRKGDECAFAHELKKNIAANPMTHAPSRVVDPAFLEAAQQEAVRDESPPLPQLHHGPAQVPPKSILRTSQPRPELQVEIPQPNLGSYVAEEPHLAQEVQLEELPPLSEIPEAPLPSPALPTEEDLEADQAVEEFGPPVLYTFTLDMDEMEMDIKILTTEEFAWFFDYYLIDTGNEAEPDEAGNRRALVKPRLVQAPEVQELINEVYDDRVDFGVIMPGDDQLEFAELADELAEEDSFLVLSFGWVVVLLYPSRGDDLEKEDGPIEEEATIAYEIRVVSEEKRNELEIDGQDPEDLANGVEKPEAAVEDIKGKDMRMEEREEHEEQEESHHDDEYNDASDAEDEDSIVWDDVDEIEELSDEEEEVENEAAIELFESTFDVDLDDLFIWPVEPHELNRDAYVLMDDDREAEIDALSELLAWCGVHVATPEDEEAWAELKEKNREGIIILEDRLTQYRHIPDLSHLLFCRYNFFELDTSSEVLSLKPIFMTGHVIILTDQIIQEEPERVMEIVTYVRDRNKTKLPGTESRRIYVRPGVSEWLMELAEQDMGVDEARRDAYMALWQEFMQLKPSETSDDILEFPDHVVYEPQELFEHHDKYEADANAATLDFLNAVDTTFCQYREVARNWIVLHPNTEPAIKWAAELGEEEFCNLHFMTVDDYKSKAMN